MINELRMKLRSCIVLCKILLEMLESAEDGADNIILDKLEQNMYSSESSEEF